MALYGGVRLSNLAGAETMSGDGPGTPGESARHQAPGTRVQAQQGSRNDGPPSYKPPSGPS